MLITIVLLSFLVLLLVSLASLTRVETRVAQNSQQIDQARQNAMFGLQIAIGQLQLYAGPDQRTTVRADMDSALVDDSTRNGRWLGAYGSRVSANYADEPATVASKIAAAYSGATGSDAVGQSGSIVRKGSQAILLNWLVSGNETQGGFSPSGHVASDGHITLTASPVSSSSSYHLPTNATLTQSVLLPGAADSHALLVGTNDVTSASDKVGAPLVPISISQALLPGFSSTSGANSTIGRYAWWAGDEGAKASVNPSLSTTTAVLPPAAPAEAFTVAQRHAIELMDAVHPVGSSTTFSSDDLVRLTAYDPTQTQINRLLASPQLSAMSGGSWGNIRKFRFHDLTVRAQSLFTDTYAGGLKKDLSALLATGAASPADDAYLFPAASGTTPYGLPTWGKLRSFVRNPQGAGTSDALTPRLPSKTDVGLYPVMSYSDIRLQYIDGISLAISPRVVLWNPYTRPIKAARYEFGISSSSGKFQLLKRTEGSSVWTSVDGPRQLKYACATTSPSGVDEVHFMRFIIDATEDIPAGASYTYGINGTQTYNAPYGSKPTNIMVHTATPGYATMPIGISSEANAYYRVKAGDSLTAIQFLFEGQVYAYLGQDPSLNASASAKPVWPPDGTTTNTWYQATMNVGYSGSSNKYATADERAVNPSLPFLQNDPDPYNDTSPDTNIGVELYATPGTDWWGSVASRTFASRARYLVTSNPRASYATTQRGIQANHFPGYDGSDKLDSITSDGRASSVTNFKVSGSPQNSILYEYRRQDMPLMSVGQLQHADLSMDMDAPTYLIGNAVAPGTRLTTVKNQDRPLLVGETYAADAATTPDAYRAGRGYDTQYLANRALWDRYFVSTIPSDGTSAAGVSTIPDVLPNPRNEWLASASNLTSAQKRDGDQIAAHLVLKGGFNINSTSEQAWRAVLGGMNRLNYSTATIDTPANSALPRFASPPPMVAIVAGRYDWAHSGYRTLSDEQIAALAKTIVEQIRARGPFISMGDFINRRLRDNPDTTDSTAGKDSISKLLFNYRESVKGTLQEAIDTTPSEGTASINNRQNKAPFNNPSLGQIDNTDVSSNKLDTEPMMGGAYDRFPRAMPFSSLNANTPQFLTQADILSAIGAGLAARSDTFVVRTYGDAQNPVTGEITGRAWCEAVVQRTIDPVNRRSSVAGTSDYYEPAAGTSANPDLGRRFKIISFRWLNSNDI